jgi:hypothetical protein
MSRARIAAQTRDIRARDAGPHPRPGLPGFARLLRLNSLHHETKINADHLPDETPIRPLGARMVCTRCGHRGADVRPDWSPHTEHRRLSGRRTMARSRALPGHGDLERHAEKKRDSRRRNREFRDRVHLVLLFAVGRRAS